MRRGWHARGLASRGVYMYVPVPLPLELDDDRPDTFDDVPVRLPRRPRVAVVELVRLALSVLLWDV